MGTLAQPPRSGRPGSRALVETGIPAAFAALGLLLLGLWVGSYLRFGGIRERPLGTDIAREPVMPVGAASGAGGPAFVTSGAAVAALPGLWPGFRGPNRDNVSPETVPLARTWPPQGPPALWSVNLGEGYAGPAVRNGRVYVLDYDQAAQADALRCFALADGREVWRRSYPVVIKRNHGMSRTVPAVTDRYVVTLGPKCHLMCCDAVTGELKWQKELVQEFGATVPEWYAGQCPLIDGDRVIIAPGGKALMAALDLATGKVLWQTPNPRGWQMTHSSIVQTTFGGQKLYVYCASGGVAGVAAKDGALLWDTDKWTISTATVPSPLPLGDGRILLAGGYNSGALMLRMTSSGGRMGVETVFQLPPSTFGADQHTPILYKGSIYGIVPGGQLACLSLDGKRVWASGTTKRFGLGPFLIADGTILAMDDKGVLTMAEASPAGYRPIAEAKVLEGPDAWGPMALAGGRLLARDLTRMVCLDVGRH